MFPSPFNYKPAFSDDTKNDKNQADASNIVENKDATNDKNDGGLERDGNPTVYYDMNC